MAEIQFDAVLNDQMTGPLAAIADALAGISDAVGTVAKDFTAAFENMTAKAVGFADIMPEVGTEVDAVAEKIGLFADESAVNYVQAVKAMQDANIGFFANTDEDVLSLTAESGIVDDLAKSFGGLAEQKDLAGISEEDLKNASDGTSAALTGEAGAATGAAAAVAGEADAGLANQNDRAGGYGAIMGAVAFLGMAGAAIKVGASMLQSGIQSQAALTMVTSLADQNTQHIGIYEQGLQQIALSTGASLTDLAGGLYNIASVGFTGADGLKILAQAAKAAAVGGTSLADVTNGLTSIMIAFGMNAQQSAGALNTLVIGVRDGKAHFPDFARAIGLVGDTAKNANFSFNEATAALSAMSAVYPTVRQAGQNLRSLMQDLGMKMDTVAKNAKSMGLAFDEQKFASKGLYDRLVYLRDITHGNQAELMKLLGGVQGLNAYFAITASGGARFAQALGDMQTQTGTLDQAFTMYQQSMEAHIKMLSAAVGVLSASFALLAQPVVIGALSLLTKLVTDLAYAFEHHSALMTAIIITLAGLIGGLLVGSIIALSVAMEKFMGDALDVVSPAILIGIAIGLLIAYFVAAYQHSQPFRDALGQLGDALGRLWAALQPVIQSIGHLIGQALQPLMDALFGTHQGVGKNHDALQNIKSPIDLITLAIQGLTGWVNQLAGWLESMHQKVVQVTAPTTILGQSLGGLRSFVQGLKGPVDAIKSAFDGGNQTFKATHGALKNLSDGLHPVGRALGGVKSALDGLHGPLSAAQQGVHNAGQAAHGLGQFLRELLSPILGIIAALIGGGGAFALISTKTLDTKAIFSGFMDIVKNVRGHIADLVSFVRSNFMPVLDQLASFIRHPTEELRNGFGGIVDKYVLPALEKLGTKFGDIKLAIQGFMDTGWQGVFENLARLVIQGAAGFGELASTALTFTGIAMLIAGVVLGTVMQFKHWYDTSASFRKMIAGFGDDLKSIWTTLVAQINPVFKQLSETWKTQILPLGAQLMTLWQSIQPALMLVGAIVIGVLVVAFGILVSIIKAVISALGPFLTGLIQVIGGIIRMVVGFVQIIVTVVGGIATLLYDLIFNQKAFGSDLQKLWTNLGNGISNIVGGFVSVVAGLWNGIVVTIVTLVTSFVGNIISWFQHLFDTLVGHSIVTDLVNQILALFKFIFVTIPNLAIQFVLNLLMKFQMLVTMAEAYFIGLSLSIPATFIQMVTNILNAALHLELEIFNYLNQMVVQAINFFVRLQIEAPILINQMVAAALAIFSALESQAVTLVQNLVTNAVGAIKNLVSLLPSPVQDAINAVFKILGGALGNATTWGQNFIKNLAGGITSMLGNIKSAVGNVVNAIAGPLAHHSPAKEGLLANDDKWMPNMMDMMTDGIRRKTPQLQSAVHDVAGVIQGGIQANSGAIVASGVNSGAIMASGSNVASGAPQTVNMTINLQGGLGAGLQLLNPADRKTFIMQIAQELAHQTNLQGRPVNGYSGF